MAPGLALDHAAWGSPWRGRALRDKAVLCGGLLVAALALPPIPGAAAVAVASLALLLGPIQAGARRLGRLLLLPVASIGIGVATVAVSISWDAGLVLRVTPAGIAMAIDLAVRALAATLALFTLACSTPMIDLLAGLRRLRIPDALIEIAALIYRFTFTLLASAGAVRAAQEARLGYTNRRSAMRSASYGVTAVFLRAWEQAQRLESGLAGRGYQDALRTLDPPRRHSASFVAGSIALVAVIVAGSLAWRMLA